jgi:hypothetical protein
MFLCLDNSRWNVEGHMKEYAKVVEMVTPYPFFFHLWSLLAFSNSNSIGFINLLNLGFNLIEIYTNIGYVMQMC